MGVRVEDVDKEISSFDSNHCFEGFIFGFREIIHSYNVVCTVEGRNNYLRMIDS